MWGWRQGGIINGDSEVVGVLVRDVGPMMIISDLFQLTCRKFACIQFLFWRDSVPV